MIRGARRLLVLAVAVAGSISADEGFAASNDTIRVSVDSNDDQLATWSEATSGQAMSLDGRYVAFVTQAPLVAADTNTTMDVYVRDLRPAGGPALELISTSASGTPLPGGSFQPVISSDGSTVAFVTNAAVFSSDTNGDYDVFVRKRGDPASIRWASVNRFGGSSSATAGLPAVSATGRFVTFQSSASDLVVGDSNGGADIFLRDTQSATTERVSVDPSGGELETGFTEGPAPVSSNGRFVAFQTSAPVVASDGNGKPDVYLRDRQSPATTTRVSVRPDGGDPVGDSSAPAMSDSGALIAFVSCSDDLVSNDSNGTCDVFSRTSLGPTRLLSSSLSGRSGNGLSRSVAVAANAGFVAFASDASDLVTGDANSQEDVFVRAVTGSPRLASISTAAAQGDGASFSPSVSSGGTIVEFGSVAANLVNNDTNGERDVFTHQFPANVPGAPTNVTATGGNAQATLTWAAPTAAGGSSITGYTITASPGGLTKTVSNVLTAVFTGLTNGTTYTFTIVAKNAIGDGPPSAPSNPVTPRTVPGAPTNVLAAADNGNATVSWNPPARDGGSPITTYTIASNVGGFSKVVDSSVTNTMITGLTNGTSYRFKVRASNAAGDGPFSALSAAVVPKGAPGAPSGVVAVAGDRIALVRWSAPASTGGSGITHYIVTASPGGNTTTVAMPNGTIPGAILAGLDNGTTYTFTVVARNAIGDSPVSDPSGGATPTRSARTILVSSTRTGSQGQDIWAMDETGGLAVRVMSRPGNDTSPEVSPDGTQVAFTSAAAGLPQTNEIWTMQIDGTGLTQLTNNSVLDSSPTWSPDGSQLAFVSTRQSADLGTDQEIWAMNADGTAATQLTFNNVADADPDWSPLDAQGHSKIAWASAATGYEIWTMDPDGSHRTKLTEGARSTLGPDWSPDATRIAFYSNRDPDLDKDVYVMDANGANQTNLTQSSDPNLRQDWSPAWSADGSRIVFGSTRVSTPNYDVYTMASDGTDPVNVTRGVGQNSVPTWHPARGLPAGFVARNGTDLTLNRQPYKFTGLNIYNANSDGWCWYQMDAPVLEQSLSAIGPGKGVIRAWFFQPLATTKGAAPKRDWSRFDHTLEAAGAAGVRVIVTLTDEWGECGSDQANPLKDATWYESGYKAVDPGNLVSYRNWVQEVVARYKNDPRIAFWQLINEAEYRQRLPDGSYAACPQGTNAPADVLKTWAADVSGLIKTIDPNHLVSLGSIGGGQCGMQGDQYKYVHDIPTIDLCEYHDYGDPSAPLPGDQWNGFQVRVQQCNELNKPLFVGEVGIIPNDVGGLQGRADALTAKKSAMFNLGADGFLAWAWSKDGSTLDNYDIGPGDPALSALDLP